MVVRSPLRAFQNLASMSAAFMTYSGDVYVSIAASAGKWEFLISL